MSQIWQGFVGLVVPAAKQVPPTTQPAHVVTHISVVVLQTSVPPQVVVPATQVSPDSLHVSVPVHATPSEQFRAVPEHARAEQRSPSVQKRPSSQVAPSFALHTVGVAVRQTSHGFMGLTWPAP